MTRKYLAFDIETAREWPDGQDWRSFRPLGISCAATLPADAQTPALWHNVADDGQPGDRMDRPDAAKLVEHLTSMAAEGYTILTFNGLGFDFDVLGEESDMVEQCRRLARSHVDMMFHVFCVQGYPVGLDAAARAMNLPGKPEGMTGLLAPKMWAEGKRREVLDYVTQDVRTTLDLAVACERLGGFRWITRRGKPSRMPLTQGWHTVESALKLPLPDTSWMDRPLSRDDFTGWLDG